MAKAKAKSEAKKRQIASVGQEEVEQDEEAKVDEPNAKKRPMTKAGAKNKNKAHKGTNKTSSAVTSVKRYLTLHHPPGSKDMYTTSAWLHIQERQVQSQASKNNCSCSKEQRCRELCNVPHPVHAKRCSMWLQAR